MHRERGFTLLEVAVALGIAAIFGLFLLQSTVSLLHWSGLQAQRDVEAASIGELVDRWQADADSAWAIFTPARDVNGVSNGDGHEVDFFTRDAKYQSYFWAYTYDVAARTLTRYLYAAPGSAPAVDQTYAGITGFYAHTYPVTALADSSSKVYSPLYGAATLTPGAVRFYGAANPSIAGGNQITYLRIDTPSRAREMRLVTNTAPTGFTVVLDYTPRPSATSTPSPLNVWPAFLQLPVNGQSLSSASAPQHDVAYFLNALLAGGFAQAAGCSARAFTDGTYLTPLADAQGPGGFSTDGTGCISGPGGTNVALYEAGYNGTFNQSASTCGAAVNIAGEIPPAGQGPQVDLASQGRQIISSCSTTWSDQNPGSARKSVGYQVAGCTANGGIVPVGASCSFTTPALTPMEFCDYMRNEGGTVQSGYTNQAPVAAMSPSNLGTVKAGQNGSYTFTRSTPGTVTVTVTAQWETDTANPTGNGCRKTLSNVAVGSATYQ